MQMRILILIIAVQADVIRIRYQNTE